MKNPDFVLTQQYLHTAIIYNRLTGNFTWRTRPHSHFKTTGQCKNWNARYPGTIAGKVDNNGYLNIKVNHQLHRAHRLAWFYVHGNWPVVLDHEDGDKLNNRLFNLRETTYTGNNQNACRRHDNKSGITGVYQDGRTGKWIAGIDVDKKRFKLGRTFDFFEACCLRKSAERQHGFHMNHGRTK